ncbi:unnamed protein product [Cylicostephanus goldi]|uniref:Uncharacterized protein n=1 Tax=Cylicostephanus goldi TaxID=71465 RepID=A0A3P6UWC9_CYLGO|nr:unnamed protein product [Cylicostephanus goldi]
MEKERIGFSTSLPEEEATVKIQKFQNFNGRLLCDFASSEPGKPKSAIFPLSGQQKNQIYI